MSKKLPNRGQRSKGVKVKHVLQICVLLGVCFWLIYQVKHSHDRRKELSGKDEKISIKEQNVDALKLGRKDLNDHMQEVSKNDKHEEEEDEEEARGEEEVNKNLEEEQGGEGNNHVEHEEEEGKQEEEQDEENKNEESENQGRGGGDDEIDEREQQRREGEIDHEENFIDEEKEREDEENDENNGKEYKKKDNKLNNKSSGGEDHVDGGRNTHEAREEHYKADDASSEVAHDAQSLNTSSETLEENDKFNNTAVNLPHSNSNLPKMEGSVLTTNGATLSETTAERNQEVTSNSFNSSLADPAVTSQHKDQQEASNNLKQVYPGPEVGNSSKLANLEGSINSTEIVTTTNSQSNLTKTLVGETLEQKALLDNGTTGESARLLTADLGPATNSNTTSSSKFLSLESTNSIEIESREVIAGKSSNTSNSTGSTALEKNSSPDAEARPEDRPDSLTMKENDLMEKESNNHDEFVGANKSADSALSDETTDAIQHDAINTSDSSISQDEKDARTDLETLPKLHYDSSNDIVAD